MNRTVASILLICMGLLLAPATRAAVQTWTGTGLGGSSAWSSRVVIIGASTNWSGGVLPSNGDDLVFGGVVRTINTNDLLTSVRDLSFAAFAGSFTLNGNGLTITGAITNSSGNLQTINLPVTVGATGKTWDGGGGGIALNGAFTLGNNTLTLARRVAINNGGVDFVIGNTGTAALTFANGSSLSSARVYVGKTAAADGVATVDGTDSRWTQSGDAYVGYDGRGSLQVRNGGAVSSASATLGFSATGAGVASVSGANATWSSTGTLLIGGAGSGALSILSGGAVNAGSSILGSASSGSGSVTVDGAGSSWLNSSGLTVGGLGQGALDIRNGGLVAASSLSIGGSGIVNLDGGTLRLDSSSQAAGARFNWNSGVLNYTGSASLGNGWAGLASALSLAADKTLQIGNALTVNNASLTIQNGGSVVAGSMVLGSHGTLNLSGGELRLGSSTFAAGSQFNWTAGLLSYSGNASLGNGWIGMDRALTVSSGRTLAVGGLTVDNGTLTIQGGGAVVSGATNIGYAPGQAGGVTLNGEGSGWNTAALNVGYRGNGTLEIQNGASVASSGRGSIGAMPGSVGNVTLTGAGANWVLASEYLFVGESGAGTLSIRNGASVTNFETVIGGYSGSVGSATVDGAGAMWTLDHRLVVGGAGSGTLNISNGGSVSSARGFAGFGDGSGVVTVEGSGSNWNVAEYLYVGLGGAGTLNIRSGGMVSAPTLQIFPGGTVSLEGGTVRAIGVSGSGFNWTGGVLNYLYDASLRAIPVAMNNGALVISNNRTLQVDRTLSVDDGSLSVQGAGQVTADTLAVGSTGVVGLSAGGALRIAQSTLASGGRFEWTGGTLNFTGDASLGNGWVGIGDVTTLSAGKSLQVGQTLTVGSGKRLELAGGGLQAGTISVTGGTVAFSGDNQVDGRFINNGQVTGAGGTLSFLRDVSGAGGYTGNIAFAAGFGPGNSPASVDFHGGDATFGSASVLTMELLGGAAGTGYDQLVNIGRLTFNGTLRLVFGNGYAPAIGTRFDLLRFQSFSGSLAADHIQVVGFDAAGLDFSQLASNGSLGVGVAPVPEPEAWLLLLAGLGLVGVAVRRSRRQER